VLEQQVVLVEVLPVGVRLHPIHDVGRDEHRPRACLGLSVGRVLRLDDAHPSVAFWRLALFELAEL
jgi:hypothetical protein